MTIKDVAKQCSVSPSTVSRVLSGDIKAASRQTQRRIWDAVHQLGYQPNPNAQRLKSGVPAAQRATQEIVCICRAADSLINPFFTALMHAAEITAYERKYALHFISTAAGSDLSALARDSAANAVLILGRVQSDELSQLQMRFQHIVYTGLQDLPYEIDQVISRGDRAARTALTHLIELGHRKICYIGGTRDEQRYQAYCETMREYDLPILPGSTVSTDFTPGQGYEAAQQLLVQKRDFSAIFCANDTLAIGVLKALKDAHRRVPDAISLVSIDDLETARYLSPMLTTVHIPIAEMGTTAVKTLIDRIEDRRQIPLKIELPNRLIERDSCAPCGR